MEKSQKIFLGILGFVIIASLSLYFITFHGSISNETTDWIAFGNFIAGIATLINVAVFVWLTLSISKSDENSREKDRKNQKDIIVSQLRYDDLKLLTTYLSEVTNLDRSILNYGKLAHLCYCITVFRKSRHHLFPIIKTDQIANEFDKLCKLLNRMSEILRDSTGLDQDGIPNKTPSLIPQEYKNLLTQFQDLSARIISEFEEFIIRAIS